jgi:glycosyltransferase involved in cell wall biosynthesis
MAHLASGLADQNDISVDIIVCKAVGPNLGEIGSRVRVIDLNARQMLTSLGALTNYIKREQPVAILSALEHANIIALAARSLAGSHARRVITIHNSLSQTMLGKVPIKRRFELPFMRAFYPCADAIVAVSSGVADDLALLTGISRKRIDVIYNPVISDKMIALSQEPLQHPWFSEGAKPVILNVGRLDFQKDQETLIRAFAKVRQSTDARLMILGEGEERSSLEALVEELGLRSGIDGDVLMPGFVKNPYAFISRAAVFALSSRFEGLPTVLIEALACGATIVSTDCPSGPREILEAGKWGHLTAVGDVDAFADALLSALMTRSIPDASSWAPYEISRAAQSYREVLIGQT